MFNKFALTLIVLVGCVAAIGVFAIPRASPEEAWKSLIGQSVGLPGGFYCEYCLDLARTLKKMTPDQLEGAKEQIMFYCQLAGGSGEKCKTLIDMAFQGLKSKTPEEFCTQLGFCG